MAASDATALFDEYDAEYCAKATATAAKIDGVGRLSGGEEGEEEEGRGRGARAQWGPSPYLTPPSLHPFLSQAPARTPCATSRPT